MHHLGLISSHLCFRSGVLLLTGEIFDIVSKFGDHVDELNVLSHDVHVVLLVDLLLLLKSLLKTVLSILKVSPLVVVLLLDIWIDLDILHALLLDDWVQVDVNGSSEVLEVIDVLHYPVDSIFESVDLVVVGSNLRSVFLDQVLHMLLPCSEVIDDVTQIGVNLVVLAQVVVHVVGFLLQSLDFHASWSDFSFELLDLVIEHKFELFKLLSLLLKRVNFLFKISNLCVSLHYVDALLSDC